MTESSNEQIVLGGLFHQARGEFFLGDYDAFRATAEAYESRLSGCQGLSPKVIERLERIRTVLELMRAVSERDTEKITGLQGALTAWKASVATEGFVNYLKGVCAYMTNNKEEAVYRFMLVKDACAKTVFAQLSEEYLALLR